MKRLIVLSLAATFFVACQADFVPTDIQSLACTPLFDVSDGAHDPAGNPDFFFLPPLANIPSDHPDYEPGEFDPNLAPTVHICEGTDETRCDDPQVEASADFVEDHYQYDWKTAIGDAGKTFRIRVFVGNAELGFIDVELTSSGGSERPQDQFGNASRKAGSTTPINFRIEPQVDVGGGEIMLEDGSITLDFPEGAVDIPTFITATPATNLPSDPVPVPGTAFDFGPDGIVFNQPVTLKIAYDPGVLPQGVVEEELRLHKLVNGEYRQMDAGVVDLVNKTVSGRIDGFSVYVLIERLFPGSPEDLQGPVVEAVEVFDEDLGVFVPMTSLELSTSDQVLRTRFTITDDISGVVSEDLNFRFRSPRGQWRAACAWRESPVFVSGSDTYGVWECSNTWPQYGESGTWEPGYLTVSDAVGNRRYYRFTDGEFCDYYDPAVCFGPPPGVEVVSNPTDTTLPEILDIQVSPNVQPRIFSKVLTVDVSSSTVWVVLRVRARDDLSGIGSVDGFPWMSIGDMGWGCFLSEGTATDGYFECVVRVRQNAESGDRTVEQLHLPDRSGNGETMFLQEDGRLCGASGACLDDLPVVTVTGIADADPPELQSLAMSAVDLDVTADLHITDDLTGATWVNMRFHHEGSNQTVFCDTRYGSVGLIEGTLTDGTWRCTITFSEFNARGSWLLFRLLTEDGAGNDRQYYRRAADGFLCYTDETIEVCQDFGDTDIILQ